MIIKAIPVVVVGFWASTAAAENRAECLNGTTDRLMIALCACYNVVAENDRLECYDKVLLQSYRAEAIETAKARRAAAEFFDVDDELRDALGN